METDVLIIGAGPTGLMAANQLNRFGINFIIADKKCGPTEESGNSKIIFVNQPSNSCACENVLFVLL